MNELTHTNPRLLLLASLRLMYSKALWLFIRVTAFFFCDSLVVCYDGKDFAVAARHAKMLLV